jgi:hypothetical protein
MGMLTSAVNEAIRDRKKYGIHIPGPSISDLAGITANGLPVHTLKDAGIKPLDTFIKGYKSWEWVSPRVNFNIGQLPNDSATYRIPKMKDMLHYFIFGNGGFSYGFGKSIGDMVIGDGKEYYCLISKTMKVDMVECHADYAVLYELPDYLGSTGEKQVIISFPNRRKRKVWKLRDMALSWLRFVREQGYQYSHKERFAFPKTVGLHYILNHELDGSGTSVAEIKENAEWMLRRYEVLNATGESDTADAIEKALEMAVEDLIADPVKYAGGCKLFSDIAKALIDQPKWLQEAL